MPGRNCDRSASDCRTCWSAFDEAGKQRRIAELEGQTANPALWDEPDRAQGILKELSDLTAELAPWRALRNELEEAEGLLDLAAEESDQEVAGEVLSSLPRLRKQLDKLEFQLTLSGPYDRANAILAISAGAGGTDAQDWAQILLRMYLRWAERRGYSTETYDLTPGEEAGIKSATVEIAGRYAFGYLRSERGVHRLVRLSPFDASHRRHTSFALVEVMPDVETDTELKIDPEEVKFEAYRSGGPGGQNVNKVSTAVRLTHVPSGIVVTAQTERSQLQNRETAMRILRAKLLEIEAERREAERLELRGQHVEAGWGNQIRSYVVHPYNQVKDLRTGYESSDPNSVLDGDLDDFMNAYLSWSVGAGTAEGSGVDG
jgi:peptide chain release factor 2